MPPLVLTSLLEGALPSLSSEGRAVVSALGCFNGKTPSAHEMAAFVGLRDRFQLARVLRRDGLPPLEHLAGWTRVAYWLVNAEATGATLRHLARRDGLDPAVAYRLVHRITGLTWLEARRAGLPLAVLRLRERCVGRVAGRAAAQRLAAAVGDGIVRVTREGLVSERAPLVAVPRPRNPGHPQGILSGRQPVSGSPCDIVFTPDGAALVSRLHAAAVDVLRPRPFRTVASIRTGPAPTSLCVSPAGTCAYVTCQFSQEVGILDLRAAGRTSAIPVDGDALGANLSADGRTLYVTTNHDRLFAVALPAGRVVGSMPVPLGAFHLIADPSGRRVYVSCFRAGLILEADARALRPLRQFAVGGVAQDLALSADGLRLYATNQAGWLNVIQLTTGQIMTYPLGAPAVSLALSPDDAVLYAGLVFDGRVLVLDARTLQVRTILATGGKPRRIAFDATGRTALIANETGWVDLVR